MFENIGILDINTRIKKKYNLHLSALKNFIKKNDPLTGSEKKILSIFCERSTVSKLCSNEPRGVLLLNIMGSLRVLFYTAPFNYVCEDLKKIGFKVFFERGCISQISREYTRQSKQRFDMGFETETKMTWKQAKKNIEKPVVQIIRRRNFTKKLKY